MHLMRPFESLSGVCHISRVEPYNFCDILALNYSIFEIAFFLGEVFLDQRIKVLRIFVISRLIRVFKYSTFNKGLENLIKGLSESI